MKNQSRHRYTQAKLPNEMSCSSGRAGIQKSPEGPSCCRLWSWDRNIQRRPSPCSEHQAVQKVLRTSLRLYLHPGRWRGRLSRSQYRSDCKSLLWYRCMFAYLMLSWVNTNALINSLNWRVESKIGRTGIGSGARHEPRDPHEQCWRRDAHLWI